MHTKKKVIWKCPPKRLGRCYLFITCLLLNYCYKNKLSCAGNGDAQQLRACTALAEDVSSLPSSLLPLTGSPMGHPEP